ncbi:MAG: Ferrichrome-iron receptor [Nitrospira sp.]|nr:MAG: Ferrichrome-iron receptor [Nitrospira sp.]
MAYRSLPFLRPLLVGMGIIVYTALSGTMLWSSPAAAQEHDFNIPAQPLSQALIEFATQAGVSVNADSELLTGRQNQAVIGHYADDTALEQLLNGTGLQSSQVGVNTFTILPAPAPAGPHSLDPASSGAAAAAMAQDHPKPPKPVTVPEVVVKDVKERDDDTQSYVAEEASTATRTETPLIQVPQSVGVVTRKVMDDQKAIRVDQALRNVSGIAFSDTGQSGNAGDILFCRGFPCDYFKNYMRNGSGQAQTFRDIANIQRIEVLKGPASVLYGRSEPGGIVNLTTKQPLPDRFASLEQIIGSYGLSRTMVDVTGPLDANKTVLFRINGAYENAGSFRDFVNSQRYFVAPVVTWNASNKTTLIVDGEYVHDHRTPDLGFPALGRGLAPLPISRFLGEPFDTLKTEEWRGGAALIHQFNKDWRIESRFRFDKSATSASRTYAAGLFPDNRTLGRFYIEQLAEVSSFYWRNDVIGTVHTGSIRHALLAGVEVGRQSTDYTTGLVPFSSIDIFNPIYGQSGMPQIARSPTIESFANSAGAYVQDQISILDNLHVLVGARGDYFYQHSTSGTARVDTKAENVGFSPRIGVTYQPINSVSVYANVTRSFIPTFGPFAAASNLTVPSTGTQYEAGVKTDIVPGRLTSTVAVYRLVRRNILTQDPNAPLGISVQTGEQRSHGIEIDLAAQLTPAWKVIATYSYIDARISADNTFAVGNRLPLIARHTGSLWTTYDILEGPLQGLGAGIGMFAVGERAGDLGNTYEMPGYVRMDAALYYRKQDIFPRMNLVTQLNVQNLLDKDYFYGGPGIRAYNYLGAPLSFLGSVKLEFY